ncbi:Hypothetical protein LUCI_5161 [Lucifera butyrica]|uniref:Bacterial extracellular solute-binding protein n=1 Tax=Lucifera butyrica TaxID=1351585 RepID=A0A498RIE0_9FIRM|nr:sugar ABC transporter substrate-binding protein [Lucifera butyrica]VBB09863.1 Hypothetical protein LUCI_5161 [Lucifera butyrica]
MSKKLMVALVVLLGVAVLIAACGGTPSSGGKSGSQPVTIKVAAWNDAADSLKAEIAGFQKKYPHIKVEVQYVDNNYTKIMPKLASGSDVPDIIQTQNRDFPAFMKKFPGEFVDITDKVAGLKSKFVAAAWEPVTFDGKVYAMPWDLGPAAVYYRQDLFQQAGIEPSKIETWDDFIASGQKIKARFGGNVAMTAYADDFDLYEQFFSELGGNYTSVDGKIDIGSEQSKQALAMVKKITGAGIAIDIKDWNGRITALKNNKVAAVIYPVWYAGTLMNSMADQKGKWSVMPLPAFTKGGNNQANLGGSVLAITKQSRNPDAAWKFIEYCLATDAGQTVMLQYGLFPSYEPFYESAAFKKQNDYFGRPLYSFFAKLTEKIPPMHRGPIMLDASKPLADMQAAVIAGQSIEQATSDAAQEIAKKTGLAVK